jgi:DNA-directed RNA polymerase subunit RPC12/RpoP
VKVQGTCDTCGRTFLLSQIGPDSDAPGRCPFCGARFARHYMASLIETVRQVEIETDRFVTALSRLQAMETGFDIDVDQLLKSIEQQVRDHERPQAS